LSKLSTEDIDRSSWAKNRADEWNVTLIEVKKEQKLSNDIILAMSPGSDPYWMTTGKMLKALWAQEVMKQTIIPHLNRIGVENIHLRDIHYTLTSDPNQKTWDGERYLNTVSCWKELITAFAVARYTNMVDWQLIRDNKNIFYQRSKYDENKDFTERIEKGKKGINVNNIISEVMLYRFYDMLNQWNWMPVHVEIWCEKDLPLLNLVCEAHGINCVIGEGETSITQVFQLADRIKETKKPVRIGYVADCDVVGSTMSKSMARKLEFLSSTLDIDIKLVPLMLTPAQVENFGLPTVPMKPSKSGAYETRKDNWLISRGMDGAVEINSFHALYPEDFRGILERFINSYKDVDLWNKIGKFNEKVQQFVREKIDDSNIDLSSIINAIEEVDWDKVTIEYDEKVEDIGKSELDFENNDAKYNWLLDTKRGYFEQLENYHRYEHGNFVEKKEEN